MKALARLTTVLAIAEAAFAGDDLWKSQILLDCAHGLGGAAIGDLDPSAPGNEVATVSAAGEVWLVRRTDSGWQPERIYKSEGELIMCAIGDADPRYPGNEFVGVGMVTGEESVAGPGQALVLHKDGDRWVSEQIFESGHMLHGVAIGDVSPAHQGHEIIACGFDHRVTQLHFGRDGWSHETIYVSNDRLKIAVVADLLPNRQGPEVIVCGSDGSVVALWPGKLGWQHETVFSDPIGQSRIAVGSNTVLIGGDRGKVTLATRREGTWWHDFITRDTGKIRGVALADIARDYPGAELYACGYSGSVTQCVCDDRGFWHSTIVYTTEHPLHHLVAGEIDPAHEGPELVTCGHGGQLVVLSP